MGKVVIHATISLDGYIAGPDDDLSWMSAYAGPNRVAEKAVEAVGAIGAGGRLYRLGENDLEHNLPYGGTVRVQVFLLTHHPREPFTCSGVAFHFTSGFKSAVQQAQAAAGDKNVMLFGATMATLGLEAGLADEIQLHLAPILLGEGISLFGQMDAGHIKLQRMKVVESPTVTDLRFRILKQGN